MAQRGPQGAWLDVMRKRPAFLGSIQGQGDRILQHVVTVTATPKSSCPQGADLCLGQPVLTSCLGSGIVTNGRSVELRLK